MMGRKKERRNDSVAILPRAKRQVENLDGAGH